MNTKLKLLYWINNYDTLGDIEIKIRGAKALLYKGVDGYYIFSNNVELDGFAYSNRMGFRYSWRLRTLSRINNDFPNNINIDFLDMGFDNNLNNVSCEILLEDYGTQKDKSYNRALASKIRVGLEIERSTYLTYKQGKELINNKWVIERDGTAEGGEYITPILNIDIAEEFINRFDYVLGDVKDDNCGGHIHVSVKGKSSEDLYSDIKFYRPILWALYPKRALTGYCHKNNHCMAHSVDVGLRTKTVEFRIFPQLRTKEQLKFRLAILKFFIINPADTKEKALKILNEKSIEFINILDIHYKALSRKISVINRILKAYELNIEEENKIKDYLVKTCENLNK